MRLPARDAITVVTLCVCLMQTTNTHSAEPGTQTAQKLKVEEVDGKPRELHYLLFLPKSNSAEGAKQPLLLFLHGAGERGDQLDLVKVHGPPKIVATKPDFPFIVVSPQCPKNQTWNVEDLTKLLDHVTEEHAVDAERVYVSGLSMGGYGTWKLIAAHPQRFAAAVPICGGGDPTKGMDLKDTPIWVFHGAKDTAVPLSHSEEMVKAVEAAGGKIKFTVYPEAAHDSWTKTYNNPALYEWMLEHRRKSEK